MTWRGGSVQVSSGHNILRITSLLMATAWSKCLPPCLMCRKACLRGHTCSTIVRGLRPILCVIRHPLSFLCSFVTPAHSLLLLKVGFYATQIAMLSLCISLRSPFLRFSLLWPWLHFFALEFVSSPMYCEHFSWTNVSEAHSGRFSSPCLLRTPVLITNLWPSMIVCAYAHCDPCEFAVLVYPCQ